MHSSCRVSISLMADPDDRTANGPTLRRRFARDVTARYLFGPVWVTRDGVRPVPPGQAEPPGVARGRARLADTEGVRPAAIPDRAPRSARQPAGDPRRALASHARQSGGREEAHPRDPEGARRSHAAA